MTRPGPGGAGAGRDARPGLLHRHARLATAAAAGLLAGLALVGLDLPDRLLVGADLFFVLYIGLTFAWLSGQEATDLRARFADGDEGAPWIAALAVLTVAISLYAIVETMLGALGPAGPDGGPIGRLRPVLALAAVPLGWITLHTVMSLHYAGIFYRAADGGDAPPAPSEPAASVPAPADLASHPGDRGGLDFAGDSPDPGPWDFLYYGFTIGMTAQTSDTAVTTTEMRRLTLVHGVMSFFYNAVIVALAVNAGMALGQ